MNNTNSPTPFTDVYAQMLETIRSMIPGAGAARPVEEKKAEVVARQEWEAEGGNLKPAEAKAAKAKTKGAPKLPSKRKKAAPKKSAGRVRARR